ncbi:MAG: hypothetical protein WCK32_07690 [Chlorobiaceae bacterium]
MMRKMPFASLVSLCLVSILLWSNESFAIATWARKYNLGCDMCHSAMPQRNPVGEAFKNNGYRIPGGADELFTKQLNIKIGDDDWKKGLKAPATGSFPEVNQLGIVLNGNLIRYADPTRDILSGAEDRPRELTLNAPNTASLFYATSLGNHFTILGEIAGFGVSGNTIINPNVRAVLQFSPGFNLAVGNKFSNVTYNGTTVGGVANVSAVLPEPGTYAELNYTVGEESGGYTIVAGTCMARKNATINATENKINDVQYLRAKVKLFGAGLLSGSGGESGNQYNNNNNQVTLGAGLSYAGKLNTGDTPSTPASPRGFIGNWQGETLVFGFDIQATYKDILFGGAYSRDKDLGLNNFITEAGYFIYPWLYAKVGYADIARARYASFGKDIHQPQIIPAVSAWIAPNVSLTGTYTYFTKSVEAMSDYTNQNNFALTVKANF